MKRLDEIFDIKYGSQLDLNKCVTCEKPEGYNFVNRSSKNCGVSARILEEENKKPFPAGLITVAMGGSVLSSFVQQEPFYTGQNVKVLRPKQEMSDLLKLYYCYCIEQNIFRFSTFGREANVSFESIIVPDIEEIPKELNKIAISDYEFQKEPIIEKKIELNTDNWKWFKIKNVFHLEKCKCSNAGKLLEDGNNIAYIGAKKNENGFMKNVAIVPKLVSRGNCIVFIGDGQGSVGYSTYQPIDFIGSTTLTAGYSQFLNQYNALFLVAILDMERYRYTFGRKYGYKVVSEKEIKLPATKDGSPDWQFMEDYIKSINYSKSL
jgi:hypothetical protein